MFYCGALFLTRSDPGFRVGAGPVEGCERRAEQLPRSQPKHLDTSRNLGAKRRDGTDSAHQNSRDAARRGGKNIDHQSLSRTQFDRGPERNGAEKSAVGIDAAIQAHLIEQTENSGAGYQVLPPHFIRRMMRGRSFIKSVTIMA